LELLVEVIDNGARLSEVDDKNINTLRKWLEKIRDVDVDSILFDRIILADNNENHDCVMFNSIDGIEYYTEISTTKFFKPSDKFYKILINRIQNSIKYKVCEGQYEDGLPFIIAIRAPDWHFEYENNYEDFIPIHNQIERYIKNFDQVSGVWLYTNNLYDGRYIENPGALKQIQLSEKKLIDVEILKPTNHRPYITYDKKIDFANLDFTEKTLRLNQILELEPNFDLRKDDFEHRYARSDLIELFENIILYLKEKELDHNMLIRIEQVIYKYIDYREDHESDYKDSNIMFEEKVEVGTEPIRSVATSALSLLIRHVRKETHLTKIMKLSKDEILL
jgi:hypothetical protein